jgi:hypothetical protein
LLKVESDIEVAQEVQSNNAVNTVLLGNGIDKSIEVINFSISQGEGFEGDFGDNMGLGSITKRKAKSKMKNAKVQSKNQKWALNKPADFGILNCNFDFLSLNFNLISSVIKQLPCPFWVSGLCKRGKCDDKPQLSLP